MLGAVIVVVWGYRTQRPFEIIMLLNGAFKNL